MQGAGEGFTRAALLRRAAGGALALSGADALWRATGALAANPNLIQHFHSRPDLRPPLITIRRATHEAAPGYLFLAPSSGPGQRGVLILDGRGKVVWFHPTTPNTAMNFRTAVYHGKPVLTWWEGHEEQGLGTGTHVIVDDSYRELARIPAGNRRQSDLHEFVLTPRGTALVSSYETRTMDTTAWGGFPGGEVVGGVAQELELPSGRVLFEWKSLDHVSLDESHQVVGRNFFDYFHINSIDQDAHGDLIVSARNTWAVYKISRRTGRVLWRLGGRKSDFRMGKGTVFAWQHDARVHDHGRLISLFDDASFPQVEPQSRALLIRLDERRRTATLVRAYKHHPGRLVSKFMGNAQLLPNGNVVVGWGGEPFVTEFAPDGSIVFDAALPPGGQNYRALRFPWTGRPVHKPRIATAHGSVFASWNGATDVAAWRLHSGKARSSLSAGRTFERRDFETAMALPYGHRYAFAEALDASGHELARTPTIRG